ncbi:MAG: hypothetical protein WCE38_08330 [Burkholderiales bacterium]
MLERDATRIVEFVQTHPEHFELLRNVAAPFYRSEVADGVQIYRTEVVATDGPGRHGIYRAERAGEVVSDAERKTAHCVFRYPDGRSSLQVASVALGHHKWEFKPAPCWLFPVHVVFAGERDGVRCYRLEYAGGHVDFVDYACGWLDPNGLSGDQALAEEIACFREWFPLDPERFINEVQPGGATERTDPIRG